MKKYKVILENEAYNWENATPIGNGSMGAMIYGNVATERIQLNHEKFWSGIPKDRTSKDFKEKIDYIRQLLLDGRSVEADNWANENLKSDWSEVDSYETAGELLLKIHSDNNVSGYKRELSLNDGIATVSYKKDDVNFKRTYFASYPCKVIAVKLTADKKGAVSFNAFYERENTVACIVKENVMTTTVQTVCRNHTLDIKISFFPVGGSYISGEKNIIVENADECIILIQMSYEKSELKPYEDMLDEHLKDFSALMERSDIVLDEDEDMESLPVDKRLKALRNGKTDNGLVSLYFQFGKYLLVSSSRQGTLPANLQGVWSEYIKAPWNSDYHTNINLQMNYWNSEVANLSECHIPLFDYIENYIIESGKHTAKVNYNCRGTVLHHLSDIYGFTTPADGVWGIWPMGGAWLCYHYWEHYLFTQDLDFLRERAYNVVRENVLFFLDYMFENENGMLLTGPSSSPENRYLVNGEPAFLSLSPTMDVEIVGGLFRIFLEIEKLLKIDKELEKSVAEAYAKLPPLQIGKNGQLMEWLEDYEEVEPGHRHISHAFALYPDCAINSNTPELFEAMRKTVEIRLTNGGGHTGWSCAWVILIYSRLYMAQQAYENLIKLFTHSTNDNLLDNHPPFEIDGNFGGSAAIAEMLLQSQNGEIHLLPALPDAWKNGKVKGLVCRSGVTVDFEWENGRLSKAVFYTDKPKKVKVRYGERIWDINISDNYALVL